MMGVCFLVNLMTSSSDPMRQYFGRNIFDSRPRIRVFRALD